MRSDQVAECPPRMETVQPPWALYPKPQRFPWDLLLSKCLPTATTYTPSALQLSSRWVATSSWGQPALHPSFFPPFDIVVSASDERRKPGPTALAVWPPLCLVISRNSFPPLPSRFLRGSNPSRHCCFALPGASSQCCLGIHFLKQDLSQQHLILQLSSSLSSLYLLASTIRLGRGCNFRQCNIFKGWMCRERASQSLSTFGVAPQPVVLESSGLLLRGPQMATKKAKLSACLYSV